MLGTGELDGDATEIGPLADTGLSEGAGSRTARGRYDTGKLPAVGERVGHFEVRGLLGVGGMGAVLLVHDERLDRKVALKLVRPELGLGTASTRGTERLLAEARAMAKISHANVITVYEVGVVQGQVFLAMEYIDGQTLGEWTGEQSWQSLVQRWSAAGRGLVAAHAAGLVHRDFKPANVLVAEDRTLVTDFGIAYSGAQEEARERPEVSATQVQEERPVTSAEDLSRGISRLTQTGGLLGTPRYMAPEQYLAQRVDARADQFAFCVSLWEAVYREHPFNAETAPALALAVTTGKLREPEQSGGAPERLRRILTRGLATQPDHRYPDLAALFAELDELLRARARRRRVLPLLLGAPLLAAGAWALWPQAEDPCTVDVERWSGVWDAEVEADIEAALAQAEAPYLRASWPRLRARLELYARAWDTHAHDACTDTRVRESVSVQMLDRRMSCLDSSQRHFAVLTRYLRGGELLERSIELAASLPVLDECSELARLEAKGTVPAEHKEELAVFDEMLAEALMLSRGHELERALALLEPWEERVLALGDPRAEARYHLGFVSAYSSIKQVEACAALRRAYPLAVESADVGLASECALQMASCPSQNSADDRSDFWLEVARAGYEQLDRPLDFIYHSSTASVHYARRDSEAGLASTRAALAVADEHTHAHSLMSTEGNLGGFLAQLREFEEARVHFERAVELGTEIYGPHHPNTLMWQANGVALELMVGSDYAQVFDQAEQVLAAQREGLGEGTLTEAMTLTVMGIAARQLDRVADATTYDREALSIREEAVGATHWLALESREKLARDYVLSGEHARGIAELRRNIELLTEQEGPEGAEVGRAWTNLGWALDEAERLDEAIEAQRRGRDIMLAANPDSPSLFEGYAALGRMLLARDDFAAALPELERARELCQAHDAPTDMTIGVLFRLAKARAGAGAAAPEAPAREALELIAAEAPEDELREDIEAWLREREQ